MPDGHDAADAEERRRERTDTGTGTGTGTGTVEAYEVDGGVVLHDAEEPFAWVEATLAVDLTEAT